MRFAILITASPFSQQAATSAYHFCQAVLKKGHTIKRVFFYQDAVYTGSRLACLPRDEFAITENWANLANEYQIDLALCVTASVRRGVLNEFEAKSCEKSTHNLHQQFRLTGIGQLIEEALTADRFITFGA